MSGEEEGIDPPASKRAVSGLRRRRFAFGAELAVLVEVRSEVGLQFGFVRGLSSKGCVLEMGTPPRLGSTLRVRFAGVEGSAEAEERELEGYAQHAMLWRIGEEKRRIRRVVVKWLPAAQLS